MRLLAELQELNKRTYKAGPDELKAWGIGEGPDDIADWPLELMAKYGLALFLEYAQKSVETRLPMLLDY